MGSGPKFVLVALADHGSDHSGEDWTCWPSIERLIERTGMGDKTVRRHLEALEADGWISRVRKVRPDGKMGVYVYRLHRERMAGPAVNLTGGEGAGPAVNLTTATGQFDHEPPVNLTGHSKEEPSVEPSREPSQGAREPGDAGFEKVAAMWPDSGRAWTDWPKARAAWALACDTVEAERLAAAVAACATDPRLAKGDHGWPGLHTWLSGERWRAYLPAEGQAVAAAAPTIAPFPHAGIRAAVLALRGEAWVGSYLDPAAWDGELVIPRGPSAHGKLAERDVLAAIEAAGGALARPLAKLNEGQAA